VHFCSLSKKLASLSSRELIVNSTTPSLCSTNFGSEEIPSTVRTFNKLSGPSQLNKKSALRHCGNTAPENQSNCGPMVEGWRRNKVQALRRFQEGE
jgi:hypothetical protein